MRREESSTRTLKRILEAAEGEFGGHGFAGARMERIARRAGVNKASLYYHVGGKQALYKKVLMDILPDLKGSMTDELEAAQGARERMAVFIRMLADTIALRESISKILLSELARGFKSMPQEVVIRLKGLFSIFRGIVIEGKEAGVFRSDYNPHVGHAMAMGGFLLISAGRAGRGIQDIQADPGFSYQPPVLSSSCGELAEEVLRYMLVAMVANAGMP
ncbi:MAG TPA: TetR/AcrR family transcriptional regulator [Nitrospirae bacterium]|nr:TetR/AcrR family transcriptional regulator [Nitrospirota bacterium]